jgi:hypothetical protein
MNGEVRECLREHDVHTRDNRQVSVHLPTQRVLGAMCKLWRDSNVPARTLFDLGMANGNFKGLKLA